MVDTRDVAAVAAVALTEPGHEDQFYDLTGPEAHSYADVAAAISEVQGRTVTYVDQADAASRSALLGVGFDEWLAAGLADLYQSYRRAGADGFAAQITDTIERVPGRQARSLSELLSENRAATVS
jgi:uncharacterized protein YbjT (DUF2867 family)